MNQLTKGRADQIFAMFTRNMSGGLKNVRQAMDKPMNPMDMDEETMIRNMRNAFAQFDSIKDGTLNKNEFKQAMDWMGFSGDYMNSYFESLTDQGRGRANIKQLVDLIFSECMIE